MCCQCICCDLIVTNLYLFLLLRTHDLNPVEIESIMLGLFITLAFTNLNYP